MTPIRYWALATPVHPVVPDGSPSPPRDESVRTADRAEAGLNLERCILSAHSGERLFYAANQPFDGEGFVKVFHFMPGEKRVNPWIGSEARNEDESI